MVQVLSTNLPNGRKLNIGYDAIARAAMELYHAGQASGQAQMATLPQSRRTEARKAAVEQHEKTKKRGTEAFEALENEVGTALAHAIADTWDQAMASISPYRCGNCYARFETAGQLIEHAIAREGTEDARPECRRELEASLRLASEWSRPKVSANGS